MAALAVKTLVPATARRSGDTPTAAAVETPEAEALPTAGLLVLVGPPMAELLGRAEMLPPEPVVALTLEQAVVVTVAARPVPLSAATTPRKVLRPATVSTSPEWIAPRFPAVTTAVP